VKKDQVAFLVGGLAFGFLLGFAAYHTFWALPGTAEAAAQSAPPRPAGPTAMTQAPPSSPPQAAGGAPMVAEIDALKRRFQENPKDLEAATRLAHLHHDVGMWREAIAFYARAIELSPQDPDLLTDKGVCHQEVGEFEQALRLFSRAQEVAPGHWQSLHNQAVVLGFRLGRYDEAAEALARLGAARPDFDLEGIRNALDAERARRGNAPS
jgi:tetratricopeptide (TPR) repeat protein